MSDTRHRAIYLRDQAEALAAEAESLRNEASDLDADVAVLYAQADEAECATVEDDAEWAERYAARTDRRQMKLWGRQDA